jgi:DNA replication and repair protein RecF
MAIISNLTLENFRNFHKKNLEFNSNLILLTGNNGIGKTSIIEAMAIIGRGSNKIRGASYDEMINHQIKDQDEIINQQYSSGQYFSIIANIKNHQYFDDIAIRFTAHNKQKQLFCNRQEVSKQKMSEYRNYLINFIFLTPQLEQIFILGKSQRREYLDQIVLDIEYMHSERLNNYQKLLKERLKILDKANRKNSNIEEYLNWLKIIENKIVEIAIVIAFSRVEAIKLFNQAINDFDSKFPKSRLEIIGDIEEKIINNENLVSIEDFYHQKLIDNRIIDLQSNKTNFGIHRSDFMAIFCDKNMAADRASTGEQKAIMIGITLARAKISSLYKNLPTILLFDEIFSHLDEQRKICLIDEIIATNLQTFFTATSSDMLPAIYQQFQILFLTNTISNP